MKEKFIDKRMSGDKLNIIDRANRIINEYLQVASMCVVRSLFPLRHVRT